MHSSCKIITTLFFTAMISFGAVGELVGQESAPAGVENADQDSTSLDELFRQWKELDQELGRKEAEFKVASEETVQQDIKGQYKALVTQSEELVEKIKAAAIKNLDSGDLNETNSKLLIGLMMNETDFGRDNDAIKLGDQFIAAGGDGKYFMSAAQADRLAPTSKELFEELYVRFNQNKQNDLPQIRIATSKGDILVELFEEEAPNTVANFVNLAETKFYDGLKFHRVIEGFVAQGGDPKGNGSGGPGYKIECECDSPEARGHFMGSLSMAHSGPDTGGSQFFICLSRTSTLDGRHTVFGRVIDGIEVLDKLSRNATMSKAIEGADTDVIKNMTVVRKREHEYVPVKVGDESDEEDSDLPSSEPESFKGREDSNDNGSDEQSKSSEESSDEDGDNNG